MRDSNYTFPLQNRVCVSISAQLYDRRALDTSASLPLLNSLTHLTYLTSTSPRIREIITIDGGFERLLEILQDSALPRPPSPPADWYSLRGPSTAGILSPTQMNSLRHSLAFQCVVNVGVRGSETIRTRVVQSGTLDVVAQIMEVWLKGKGISIVPGPLGSQAAVDRAAREGIIPSHHRSSRDRHRPRTEDEQRERDRERRERHEARHAAAVAEQAGLTSMGTAPNSRQRLREDSTDVSASSHSPAPQASSNRPQFGTASGLSASRPQENQRPLSRLLTMEVLEQSLLPVDEPSPAEAARMSLEQRATVLRINAVARLAGLDRDVLRRNLASSTPSSERLREYFRTFGLDVTALEALRTPPTSPVQIPISRLAADRHAWERRREQRSTSSQSLREELAVASREDEHDMAVDEEDAEEEDVESTSLARRETITASSSGDQFAPPSQVEAMTPRPPSAPLPASEYLGHYSPDQGGSSVRARSIRAAVSGGAALLDEEVATNVELPRSASSSTSALSLMNEDEAPESASSSFGPAESSSAAQARARSIFEARSRADGLLSSAPAIDMTNVSNVSTPVGTPPILSSATSRDRSRTIMANARQVAVQHVDDGQGTSQDRPPPANVTGDPLDRPISRAGTEDDESADGEQLGEVMDQQIGIVGSTDDEAVVGLDDMQRGLGEDIGGVDVNAQAQAEVDMAMGAPPGAPGTAQTPRIPEMTPRQTVRPPLPATAMGNVPREFNRPAVVIAAGAPRGFSDLNNLVNVIETTTTNGDNIYNDDTILLCLQLLAYLSKYPHVRAAFHHPRRPMHRGVVIPDEVELPERPSISESANIFSLVERFTFRPSPPDPDLVKLPPDIQYWAGVIMRNACRKDETRGGVRQCANMSCGKVETFPREFAKCRRCRKAKYCGKECQSKAWQEGHRFWCNSREADTENPLGSTVILPPVGRSAAAPGHHTAVGFEVDPMMEAMRRRHQRLRDRSQAEQADANAGAAGPTPPPERTVRAGTTEAMDVDVDDAQRRRFGTPTQAVPPAPIVPHAQLRRQLDPGVGPPGRWQ